MFSGVGILYDKVDVSIVVPVYNVEDYLRQCLDSIINQTLKKLEIICVNDGSTDNSLRILEEYAKKDQRIKIINKKNAGLGSARNIGMANATGEYTGFVDSDDWVDLSMFEKLYKRAKSPKSDMVMCPIYIYDDIKHGSEYDLSYFNLDCFNDDFNDSFDYSKTKKFFFKICVTAVNKIYRTKFLKDIDVKFPEGLIFEDNPFFYKTFLNAKKVSLIRDFLYFYRANRSDSIISKADQKYFDVVKIQNISREIFISNPKYNDLKINLLNYQIGSIFNRYNQVSEEYKKEFFELIKKDFHDINLDNNEFEKLIPDSKNKYENVINSGSYREFELLEEIKSLESVYHNQLRLHKQMLEHQKQDYEQQIESKLQIINEISSSNSWKLTKPLRNLGKSVKNLR
jgi:glycosyltransferase involved in cell wall biosynthesis